MAGLERQTSAQTWRVVSVLRARAMQVYLRAGVRLGGAVVVVGVGGDSVGRFGVPVVWGENVGEGVLCLGEEVVELETQGEVFSAVKG